MHLDKGTMQKIKDASSFLQIHGMSIFPETKQPTMRHLFNVAGREEKASLLQTFEMRAKQVKNFRGLVSELESSVTSSFKTMLETRETAVKTKQRQLLQECQNKLAPLLEAFPNDPQLNLVKANLDKMLNVPSSTLNQKITPHEIELPHLQIHLNAYSEDESELIEETELLINESTNQLTQFIESKTTDFAQRNATISDGISTLKADIATQLKQVGQPPLGDRFNAKLETLSKRITELETAVKDAKPNDYAGQSKALKALEGCREEFKTIEGEIHQALQDDLNVARESRVGDLKYLITTYLEASATVSGDDTKAIRSKIKALVTEVSRAHDQSNPVTGWENYHARKEEIQSGFEQRTSTFQDLKSDCNDAWTNAITVKTFENTVIAE